MTDASDTPRPAASDEDHSTLLEIARLIASGGGTGDGTRPSLAQADPVGDDGGDGGAQPLVVPTLVDAAARGELLARLLEAVPAGVALLHDGRLEYANTTFALAFGYRSAGELIGCGGLAAILPDLNALDGDASAHAAEPVMTAARSKSGRRFALPIALLRCAPQPALQLLILHPAPQKRAASPEGQVGALLTLADALADGALLLDREGRIVDMSDGAKTLFERSTLADPGADFALLLASAQREPFAAALQRLSATQLEAVPVKLPADLKREMAADVPVELVMTRLASAGAAAICVAIRRRPEPALLAGEGAPDAAATPTVARSGALNDERGEFLAKVSHEVRTPLNSIIGFAELMREERFGPIGHPKYQEYARDIHDAGLYALSLLNDLLDLSKIDAGKLDLNFTAVDPNEVIAEAVHVMQPQARRERVVLRAALAEDLPQVLADRRSLKQILLNLLSNAIKFTPPGGQAIVSTQLLPDRAVRIRVRDTGVGMTAEEVALALEPFRQIDKASRSHIGTGLGLPLTRALVHANRAHFSITSDTGTGTRIDVTFPPDRVVR